VRVSVAFATMMLSVVNPRLNPVQAVWDFLQPAKSLT
jgi:hypothetical protein